MSRDTKIDLWRAEDDYHREHHILKGISSNTYRHVVVMALLRIAYLLERLMLKG